MTLRVRLLSAQLSHDTELLSNMVRRQRFRTPTATCSWDQRATARRHERMQEKNQFGTRISNSPPATTCSGSACTTKTPSAMTWSERAPSTWASSEIGQMRCTLNRHPLRSCATLLQGKSCRQSVPHLRRTDRTKTERLGRHQHMGPEQL